MCNINSINNNINNEIIWHNQKVKALSMAAMAMAAGVIMHNWRNRQLNNGVMQ
jgi:hypothetical protein